MARGKLIVIDGSDGSGKATQTKLLAERLTHQGLTVHTLDFPRYKDNLLGALIGECIVGLHGDFLHSDPYIASVLYGADRFESKELITQWLTVGDIVILDRYVSANQIHQGGKLKGGATRKKFLAWLEQLEYGVFRLPRPDLTIYLHMPTKFSMQLLMQKHAQDKKKQYVKKGARDTLELNRTYLENAQKSAQLLMKSNKGWKKVECAVKNSIKTREQVSDEVLAIVQASLTR